MATTITGNLTDANKTVLDRLEADTTSNNLKKNQTMGQEQFLKLITEQLKHQDPLAPMEDQQFIAQMAQLQSLESTNNLVTLAQANYALNTTMNENMKTMNTNIKALVDKLGANGTTGTTTVTNADILKALTDIQKSMEGYFKK